MRHLRPIAVALLLIAASCSHSFAETAGPPLRGALEAATAARDLAMDGSKRDQERVADELAAAAAALPAEDREVRLATLKSQARVEVARIRASRNRVLEACSRAYRAIGLAQALLPLADQDPSRRSDVLRLVSEAYAAIEAMR